MRPTKPRSHFTRFAKWTAHATGRPVTFCLAALVIVVWIVTGPIFHFQRHLAAGHQHRHDDHHVSDGLSDSGDTEPRQPKRCR
jgi:hypothetical protein